MKVLLDMNMSPRLVSMLTDSGIDTTTWSNVGKANEPDHEIMAYAATNECIVLTNDLDFGILLSSSNRSSPSVVQVRLDNLDPVLILDRLVEALREFSNELGEGALVTIDPKRTRVRTLPLRPYSLRQLYLFVCDRPVLTTL
jgi:predicted nuclease of predicted toxin-antitoxin system